MRSWVGLAGVMGALAFAAACSGGDSSTSSSTSTSTTTTVASTTTTVGDPCGGVATIPYAVKASTVAGLNQGTDQYDVKDVRIAASDHTWGGFSDLPKPGVMTYQGGYGVVHCESGGWVVYDTGSADVGCGGGSIPAVPPTVRTDLGLQCPT